MILDRLIAKSKSDPDDVAIVFYNGKSTEPLECSYSYLESMSSSIASHIDDVSGERSLVLIIEHSPLEQVFLWLGVLRSGRTPGILTPPTPKLDKEKYAADLSDTLCSYPQAHVIAGQNTLNSDAMNLGSRYSDWVSHEQMQISKVSYESANWNEKDALLFQQSSGTTGARKGMFISYANALAHIDSYFRAINMTNKDRIISWLPFYHDMGLIACLLTSVVSATPLILTSPFSWLRDPAWLLKASHKHGATLCWLPNFAFRFLVDRVSPDSLPSDCLEQMRMIISCSEPIQPSAIKEFCNTFDVVGLSSDAVSTCYAMAENTFAVTQTFAGQEISYETIDSQILNREQKAILSEQGKLVASSGRAVPDVEVRIVVDEEQKIDGEVGEIEVRSTFLIDGYSGIGEGASNPFRADGWFKTGDVGYQREDCLYVIGRSKDTIIRAGSNYSPEQFEEVLQNMSGLIPGRWAAFGVDNIDEGTEDIVLIVELSSEAPCQSKIKKDIVVGCNSSVGIAPQTIQFVPSGWLVKSSSGKISRTSCRKKYLQEHKNSLLSG